MTTSPTDPRQSSDNIADAETEDDPGLIITFTHKHEEAWDSDLDSTVSSTSTPGYKHGKHSELSEEHIVKLITEEQAARKTKQRHAHSLDFVSRFQSAGLAN